MTNTESVRRRVDVPRDSIKRVSLPHCTMQSMLNRITINCINSKNSGDSKHRPSAHNRPAHRRAASSRQQEYPPFPTRRYSMAIIYRFYEGSSGKVATYHIAIFYFRGRKLRRLGTLSTNVHLEMFIETFNSKYNVMRFVALNDIFSGFKALY